MKVVAAVMIAAGLVVGAGAAMEFRYFGPDDRQFWVGIFTSPASALLAGAGVVLWRRGPMAKRLVLVAALVMAAATIAATALDVMGPPATITGLVGAITAAGWVWSNRSSPSDVAADIG